MTAAPQALEPPPPVAEPRSPYQSSSGPPPSSGSTRRPSALVVGGLVVALLAAAVLVGGMLGRDAGEDSRSASDRSAAPEAARLGSAPGMCPNDTYPGRTDDVLAMIECFSAAWQVQDQVVLANILSADAAALLEGAEGGDFGGGAGVDSSCATDGRGMGACVRVFTYAGQTDCCGAIVRLSYALEGEGDYYGLTITDVEWQGDAG